MKRTESSLIMGLALIGVGTLFLLQTLGVLGAISGLIWALLFMLGGGAFIATFLAVPARWWALIPGFTLVGLGALIGGQVLVPALAGAWGGALFLGGIGLGFCAVYLSGRERWWALIPAGVLLTLALVAGLSETISGMDLGWIFFLGLALTFGLVAIIPTPSGHMRWALFPAGVLLILALNGLAFSSATLGIFWPVLLILGGLALAYRAIGMPQRAEVVVDTPALARSDAPPLPHSTALVPLRQLPQDMQPLERAVGSEPLELAHKEAL
jgi:hypothetical protein